MSIHLWHKLSPGPEAPDTVYVVVEVPKGSRNKYEYSKPAGVIKLDRVLYSPLHYPGDYGFIPQTYYDDNDPLDILVMMNEPTFPSCVIEARPIGMLRLLDGGQHDDKILAVPLRNPEFQDYYDLHELPSHFPNTVEHFFRVYKQLQKIDVEVLGWTGVAEAKEAITHSIDLYRKKFPPTGI